jgi:hypothetical protein
MTTDPTTTATLDLLRKATELDPEAWAAPFPDKFRERRALSVWRAKEELERASVAT